MNCNIVRDLIPLYIDKCCSHESMHEVDEHFKECAECTKVFNDMRASITDAPITNPPLKITRINDWKASVLQSALLFASFLIITVGVALEAATPKGLENGLWAFNLVIPATGFMLSLANWYFVRLYKSRKDFSRFSWIITLLITACAYTWTLFHYEISIYDIVEPFIGISITDFLESLPIFTLLYGVGFCLTLFFCIISKLLSNAYAKMLGKE